MQIYPRLAALSSICLWSSGALFILGLTHLPTCLLLAITTSISLVLTALFLTISGRWGLLASKWKLLLSAGSLLIANQACYTLAFRGAPAAQVDLINYLWPSMLVLLSGELKGRYTSSLVVAFGAGGILLAFEPSALGWGYLPGYLAALGAALSWTAFSLKVRKHSLPPEFLSLNVGLGAPIYWVLHFLSGEAMVPITIVDGVLLLLYGGGVFVVAYQLWGYAVTAGSVGEASALSYLIPLLSIIFLSIGGYVEFTTRLSWATALVLLAAVTPMLTQNLGQRRSSAAVPSKAKA